MLDWLTQASALLLFAIMLLSAPAQMLFLFVGAPLFFITALITLALSPVVLMATAVSPAVTLVADGLWLEPRFWRRRFIAWGDVHAVKVYSLLPADESNRRLFVGRKNYRAPQGIMLVVPGLPPQYRIAGFFAGEGGRGIVALTNRTHTEYDKLKKKIIHYAGDVQPHA